MGGGSLHGMIAVVNGLSTRWLAAVALIVLAVSFSCSWLNETRTSLQWFIKIKFYLLESKKTRQQCCHSAFNLSLK